MIIIDLIGTQKKTIKLLFKLKSIGDPTFQKVVPNATNNVGLKSHVMTTVSVSLNLNMMLKRIST